MTMPSTCPISSGRGQLLEARNCLLATSLGTTPGARAKSFSDALTPGSCTLLTPTPTFIPHAAVLALVLSRGELQSILFKESTRLKEFSRRVCWGGSPFQNPATPVTDLPTPWIRLLEEHGCQSVPRLVGASALRAKPEEAGD